MAKRKSGQVAKVQPSPAEEAGTVTYSTRYTPEQREAIEKAAVKAGQSPARFIREASVSRAADVLNASGGSRDALREMAASVLRQIMAGVLEERRRAADIEAAEVEQGRPPREEGPSNPEPATAEERKLFDVKEALRTCSSELVALMLEQWDTVLSGARRYYAKVSAANLLKGGDE